MAATRYEEWKPELEEDDEDGDGEEAYLYDNQKDALLFLIDGSDSMQHMVSEDEDEYSQFHRALFVAQQTILRKIISNPSDRVGIMLYNVSKATASGDDMDEDTFQPPWSKPHIYLPLDSPEASRIAELKTLLRRAADDVRDRQVPNILERTFPPVHSGAQRIPIAECFASAMFHMRANGQKTGSKRIFLITNDEDPITSHLGANASDKDVRQSIKAAKTRARDIEEANIELETFLLPSSKDGSFNIDTVWRELLPNLTDTIKQDVDDPDASVSASGSIKLEQLASEVQAREVPKRSMFNIPFHLTKDLTIGIKGFNLVSTARRGTYRWVDMSGRQPIEAETRTVYQCQDTTEYINLKEDVKLYYTFGGVDGVKVLFNYEELEVMKTLGTAPGLTLLGFQPASLLTDRDNMSHPFFIYPNEETYSGSCRVFSALLDSCAQRDVIGLGLLQRRNNSNPVIVALVPQLEELDEYAVQFKPPGFSVVILPFADEIRRPPTEASMKTDDEALIDKFAFVIKKLTTSDGTYDPDRYPNPILSLFYSVLEAQALNDDIPNEIEDRTLPLYEAIEQRTGSTVAEIKRLLKNAGFGPNNQPPHITQRAVASTVSDEAYLRNRINQPSSLTINDLKGFLRSKGISVTHKKKEDLLKEVRSVLGL